MGNMKASSTTSIYYRSSEREKGIIHGQSYDLKMFGRDIRKGFVVAVTEVKLMSATQPPTFKIPTRTRSFGAASKFGIYYMALCNFQDALEIFLASCGLIIISWSRLST